MTRSPCLLRIAAMSVAVSVLALAPAGSLHAQGVSPAARAPRDTQPTLRAPAAPSRPPSAVAPRATARAAQGEPSSTSTPRPLKRESPPVDSVRPAPALINALDPRRAPAEQPAPPAPRAIRASMAAPRAATVSDEPPVGTTARCKDGTFLLTPVEANSCADHDGIAVVFPQRQLPKRPNP